MKVLICVPRVHFYAPLVLRSLFKNHDDINFRLLTTPKVSRNQSFIGGLYDIISTQGMPYFVSQASLRGFYYLCGLWEVLRGLSVRERRALSVRDVASAHGVECWTADSVKTNKVQSRIDSFAPDYLLSLFFNQIIPPEVLEKPEERSINLHPGFLPEYRGFSPVFWQLLNDEKTVACTLHQLTDRLDAGPVYDELTVPVKPRDSYFSLYRRLADEGANLLVRFFEDCRGSNKPDFEPQDESRAVNHPRFDSDDVREFFRQGHHFWKYRDFWGIP
ncbi:MAG: methionyl-tRNA formyltransferase [bacterium]